MATHIQIHTSDNNYVHFDTHRNGYTLCGLEVGGDERMGIEEGVKVTKKVDCPDCVRIVRYCHTIAVSEFKK